ncbi:hypothetical protein [Microbacterium sp.]|uniref:hypothetical protein n=1 Tax=Microbacterium sp. TaxID=51671 RepID=UPI0039E46BA5
MQLYLYDHTTDSIIEMIGTPGPDTTAINTYVPGTYTSVFSFYNSGVQQVGQWLNTDPGVVTFVWKVGAFPGENPSDGGQDLTRILEANDETFTLGKGQQIAAFDRELRTAVGTSTSAEFNGIGHSWGLAAITSAEVAGSDYANVVSLAGAGMPEGWVKHEGTVYSHFSYRDALSMAQQSGVVWEGNNPGASADFVQHQYARDGDYRLLLPTSTAPYAGGVSVTPPAEFLGSTHALDNHNLIASDDPENARVLRDVRDTLK